MLNRQQISFLLTAHSFCAISCSHSLQNIPLKEEMQHISLFDVRHRPSDAVALKEKKTSAVKCMQLIFICSLQINNVGEVLEIYCLNRSNIASTLCRHKKTWAMSKLLCIVKVVTNFIRKCVELVACETDLVLKQFSFMLMLFQHQQL